MTTQFKTRVAPGVIVSTIVEPEPEQAQTVVFRRAPCARLGFDVAVTYHRVADAERAHLGAVVEAAFRAAGPRPVPLPRRQAVAR